MKRKSIIIVSLIAVIAVVGFLVYRDAFAAPAASFRFVTVERGNLQQTVSATGALGAVTTVSVGTQVSGQVSALLVDYNDHVTKGELLARIDPTLAQQAVVDAQANLDKARAVLLGGQRDYTRNKELTRDGLVAQSALDVSQSSFSVAQAEVKSAQVALDRARQNLAYTNILSPIDGVVVDRNVQLGQTVAASLSAPQIFLIANDLTHMQILAQVGENDIAQVKPGQQATFTVQALPNQTFNGTVQQVRLQSTTTDNVVDYTVVINVDNTQNRLLPGMTARVELQTQEASNVLKVSNAALRFKPTDEQLATLGVQRAAAPATTTATSTMSAADRAARKAARGGQGGGRPTIAALYYVDANGKLASATVATGLSDGTSTEIRTRTDSPIKEGTKLVAGIAAPSTVTAATTTTTAASSPFGQSSTQQRPAGRGGF
jgi:HlyD family secretion protein